MLHAVIPKPRNEKKGTPLQIFFYHRSKEEVIPESHTTLSLQGKKKSPGTKVENILKIINNSANKMFSSS